MTHPTDEELDTLVEQAHRLVAYLTVYGSDSDQEAADVIGALLAQLADEHRFKDRIIAEASDALEAIGKRCVAANARADRAEAALAAQIEVDARIADDYVAMRERQISVEQAKASHHIDVPQIMRWQAGKVQSREIATSIRTQPHDLTALDQTIADTRAKALTWAADQLNDSHILSAAVRTGYETPEDRIAALDRVAAAAVKSFCGARDETEALKMALRHAEDRIEAARSRIVMVRTQIEDRAAQGTAIRSA